MIYFTSDTHAFHKRIMDFCPATRRGVNHVEMTELMIEAFNKKVDKKDTLYFLGDLSFGSVEQTTSFLSRIHCKDKRWILGNHDQIVRNPEVRKHFISIDSYKVIRHEGNKFVLFHFPMREWENCHRGSYHLFGHVHGSMNDTEWGRSMDVGIDARNDTKMEPWSIDEIVAKLSGRPNITHHGKVVD